MYLIQVRDPNVGPKQGEWMTLRWTPEKKKAHEWTASYRRNGVKFRVQWVQPKI